MLVLSGCAGLVTKYYPGPERPRSELALIRTSERDGVTTGIWDIDGADVQRVCWGCGRTPREFYVLQGRHKLKVVAVSFGAYTTRPGYISFEALAGHTYDVYGISVETKPFAGSEYESKYRAGVQDVTTGEDVPVERFPAARETRIF
jgi:hypothetical protein